MKETNKNNTANSRTKLKRLCAAALFAALIYIATGVLPRLPIGAGYVHMGDAFVYLCGALLPPVCSVPAAAIGAGLADLSAGYAQWIPATVIIKGLSAVLFYGGKAVSRKKIIASLIAAVICVGGYFLFEAVVFGSLAAPLASVVGNIFQSLFSALLYFALAAAVDKTGINRKL